MTILIADIRGFSSLSESLPPEQVVNLLNVYLEGMTGVIQEYEGTIDEFIGDAIFVIFGAPVQREDDAERAVACAVAMQMDANRVNRLNRARSLPMIEIGIGIATGEAVVGNIGSIKRAKYGVVGRSVNLAARIESYTVGGQILVTEETLNAVRDMVQVGSQFIVEPKGAPEPITIYEIVGIGGRHQLSIPQPRRQLLPLYLRLPFTYVVLEEKFAGRTVYSGHVVALSDLEADLVCRDHIPLLSNLKLFFLDKDGQTVPGEIYGKITGRIDEAYLYRLRFTSLSHDARSFLDRVRATTTAA